MPQNDLFALVRAALLAGLDARFGAGAVEVRQVFQPQQIGMPSGPAVTMQPIMRRRIGALRRKYVPGADVQADPMVGISTQWWETTLQLGAMARRDPNDPAYLTLPTAMDICSAASDILQGDEGLAALAVQRVRPLRITEVRNLQWLNESDQYQTMPNFDIVLSHPETIENATPPVVTFEPDFGRI